MGTFKQGWTLFPTISDSLMSAPNLNGLGVWIVAYSPIRSGEWCSLLNVSLPVSIAQEYIAYRIKSH